MGVWRRRHTGISSSLRSEVAGLPTAGGGIAAASATRFATRLQQLAGWVGLLRRRHGDQRALLAAPLAARRLAAVLAAQLAIVFVPEGVSG